MASQNRYAIKVVVKLLPILTSLWLARLSHGDLLQTCESRPEQGDCPTGYRMGPVVLRDVDRNGSRALVSFIGAPYERIVGEVTQEGDNLEAAASGRMSRYAEDMQDPHNDPNDKRVMKEVIENDVEVPNGGLGHYPHYSKDYGFAIRPQDTCTHRCVRSKYRTYNGECNNLKNPYFGRSDSCLNRLLPPVYEDGRQAMKLSSVRGGPLPNPRIISQEIHREVDNINEVNQWFTHFGQVFGHDLLQTLFPLRPDLQPILCCRGEYHPECRPINVPKDDPFYQQYSVQCLDFVRNIPCYECNQGFRQRDGKESGTREILTRVTSWWDASLLYGNNENRSTLLRTYKGGQLKISSTISGKENMPVSETLEDFCSARPKFDFCMMSGDNRVNISPGVGAGHLLLQRQHNRLAKMMQEVNPHWSDEQIYQEIRRIMAAQIQVMVYADYLPVLVGQKSMDHYQLTLLKQGRTKYNPNINPGILNEFQVAAFRLSHSLLEGKLRYISKEGKVTEFNLREVFFNAKDLVYDRLDDILRGAIYVPGQEVDSALVDDVRNHLYKSPKEPFGEDLASLNIQRGRDQGVPGYTSYLDYCYGVKIKSFADLEQFMPSQTVKKMSQIYKDPADIDLWTGGISERRMEGGGIVGPVFNCILSIQFFRLKLSDRYWHEHADEDGSFTDAQLQSIRQTTVSKFVCVNSDAMDKINLDIFHGPSEKDPPIPCDSLPDIDLTLWRDNDGSHSPELSSHAEPEPGRPGYAQIKLEPEPESYGGVAGKVGSDLDMHPMPAMAGRRSMSDRSMSDRSMPDRSNARGRLDGSLYEQPNMDREPNNRPGRSYMRQYNDGMGSKRVTTVLK